MIETWIHRISVVGLGLAVGIVLGTAAAHVVRVATVANQAIACSSRPHSMYVTDARACLPVGAFIPAGYERKP